MARRVVGPNGLVFSLPDDVAKALVDSPSGDTKYAEEPKAEPKTARRSK